MSLFILSLLVSGLGAFANSMLSTNRMINTSNLLINDINMVRSSALNLGREVTICAANTSGNGCSGANSWNNGWIVFIDSNGNRSLDSGEEVLRQQGPIGGNITVDAHMGGGNNQWNSYQSDGSVTYLGNYQLSNINNPGKIRKVCIGRVRRPYIIQSGDCNGPP